MLDYHGKRSNGACAQFNLYLRLQSLNAFWIEVCQRIWNPNMVCLPCAIVTPNPKSLMHCHHDSKLPQEVDTQSSHEHLECSLSHSTTLQLLVTAVVTSSCCSNISERLATCVLHCMVDPLSAQQNTQDAQQGHSMQILKWCNLRKPKGLEIWLASSV